MPYRGANYSFTIDSSFRPFEMQELLTPYMMYKDVYEQQEQAYNELSDKSDMFRYLSDTLPKESKARQIYEGYANELSKQAEDLSRNGLSMNNRRALMNLKRRYQGEIGRLEAADTALQKERELRRQMNAKDGSMLYAVDNLDIDKFLDGNTPNLYNISGTELHTLGAAAGRAASSRVYSAGDEGSTLDGYYRKWVERNGYNKESMDAFRANASAIPELQQAADDILIERGVLDNLKGNPQALQRARQSVLNGIIDGSIYQENVKPIRDEGKMSAAQAASDARAREAQQLARDKFDYEKNTSGIIINPDGTVSYDKTRDAAYQRMKKLAEEGDLGGEYTIDPVTGKPVKKGLTDAEKEEKKNEEIKGNALMNLDSPTLRNKYGFDVVVGNDRQHYDYIAALSQHNGGKWYSGKAGKDNPGHNWLRGWGFGSTSNVENKWGNFTYKPSDGNLKIVSPSEMAYLMEDEGVAENVNEQLYASGYYNNAILSALMSSENLSQEDAEKLLKANGYKYTNDIQLVAVSSEWPNENENNYLVAVRTK